MVVTPAWGEIWLGEPPDVAPRPYLILTRDAAIPVLHRVLAAPVTRTVRHIPTEVPLGRDEGLRVDCAASIDNLVPIRKAHLTRRLGRVSPARRPGICAALAAATDC